MAAVAPVHDLAPAMPVLPVDAIRQAMAANDWPQAAELLAMHQHELAGALSRIDWAKADRGPWMDLLLAQRQLIAEIETQRDRVGIALARLHDDHRGARAWLRELA
jgi:hypothetical protein